MLIPVSGMFTMTVAGLTIKFEIHVLLFLLLGLTPVADQPSGPHLEQVPGCYCLGGGVEHILSIYCCQG
jgi:hypothetical protein